MKRPYRPGPALFILLVTGLAAGTGAAGQVPFFPHDTLVTPEGDNPAIVHLEIRSGEGVTIANGFTYNGKRSGVWRTWMPFGSLHSIEEFHGDVLHGIRYEFNLNGCVDIEENYRNGLLDGPRIKFHYGVQKLLDENYKDGILEGPRVVFYESGTRQEEGTYVHGKRHGPARWYNQSGAVTVEYTYHMGELEGPAKTYAPTGKLQSEGEFHHNMEQGEWKEYDEDGNLVRIVEYKAGKVIREKKR